MKKLLTKIKKLIGNHKLLFAICFLAFIIILIMLYIFFNVFIGGTNKYGDRLNGIRKVEISKKEQSEVATFLKEKEEVTDASVRIQGKIIYINIEYTRATNLDRAKEIANEALTKLDDDEKKFYDIGFFLTQTVEEGEENKGFVVTGSKNAKLDNISWIKS